MKRISIIIMLTVVLFSTQIVHLYGSLLALQSEGPVVSSLKGVCLSGGYTNLEQVAELNVSRALDWDVSLDNARRLRERDIKYHPRLLLDKLELLPSATKFRAKVEQFASEFPNTTWFFYNEPELNCQHPVSPLRAVELFDEIRAIILEIDPTARFIVGNTTFECWVNPEGIDGGAAWLKKFVQLYRDSHAGQYPPVLGYGLHLYADCCEWRGGVGYMDYLDRAERFIQTLHSGAELWATEWGTLYPGDRLIERVMEVGSFWFEMHGSPYFLYATKADNPRWCPHCEITLIKNGELTPWGGLYRELPHPPFMQFAPLILSGISGMAGSPGRTGF